jgi:hypothetical protein
VGSGQVFLGSGTARNNEKNTVEFLLAATRTEHNISGRFLSGYNNRISRAGLNDIAISCSVDFLLS